MTVEEKDAEEINALIRQVEGDNAKYLINVFRVIVEEQIKARTLDKQTGAYILEAVRDLAHQKGWIARQA